jgi:plastin-1
MAPTMRNFKDKTLANGVFFLELLAAVEPRSINWEIATPGETEEQRVNNARYAISSARKIGACVFLTHEDIIEVKAKMLLTFVASIWLADIRRSNNL